MDEDDGDVLTIAYQSGYYDGKKAAKRTWVGLTEEEVEACFHHVDEAGIGLFDFAEAIEAKLKQKNGYAEEKNT